mmetsp:Transcript_15198/g.22388  ORF Transcript_15198/g.22388 Transcript_15198/m.22388 type:complete len:118 (-) Transcript_15198:382-735(-)
MTCLIVVQYSQSQSTASPALAQLSLDMTPAAIHRYLYDSSRPANPIATNDNLQPCQVGEENADYLVEFFLNIHFITDKKSIFGIIFIFEIIEIRSESGLKLEEPPNSRTWLRSHWRP